MKTGQLIITPVFVGVVTTKGNTKKGMRRMSDAELNRLNSKICRDCKKKFISYKGSRGLIKKYCKKCMNKRSIIVRKSEELES